MSLIIPANSASAAGGYAVDNSCRFNDGSSDNLSRTTETPTNAKKYTFSVWVKRSNIGAANAKIFGVQGASANDQNMMEFNADYLWWAQSTSSGQAYRLKSNRKFRDPSAWLNIVVAYDSTQGTANNRIRMYINGVEETSFSSRTNPSANLDSLINSSVSANAGRTLRLGRTGDNGSQYFDGYMSEVCFIDGLQLDPTSFGEFDEDSGIFKPIDVSGLTFGNNGFYLETKQSGTSQNSSGLGADTSGNDNHFAVNNLTAIDQSTDTCTNNFATMNPLHSGAVTFAEGNLQVSRSGGSSWLNSLSTFAPTSGKWYVELKVNSVGSNGLNMGFANFDLSNLQNVTSGPGEDATSAGLYSNGGPIFYASGTTFATVGSPSGIMQLAMDLDNGFLYWGKDGTWLNSANPESGATGTGGLALSNLSTGGSYGIALAARNGGDVSFNFGSPPFAISSGNTDGNGYGNFEYAVPSGYYSLNTKNLSEYG